MPTNSLPNERPNPSICSTKKIKLAFLFLLSPLFFFGQTLTGLWIGALSNDSNTVRKDQSFEIALTEYRGKVFGYSRSEFIVDDTLYYVVKRVKGVIDGDICEVIDDDIIAYNFRGKLDKGIKVTSIFRRNQNDSTWFLDGTWKTNATKKYYSVTGKVNLAEEKDLTASKIFPHLEELKLAADVAFYNERKEGVPIVKLVKPEKPVTRVVSNGQPLTLNSDVVLSPSKPNLEKAEAKPTPEEELIALKKNAVELPKTETNTIAKSGVAVTPVASTKTIAEAKIPEEELLAVKKSGTELQKTDRKNIPGETVDLKPSATNKTIAEAKIPVTAKVNTPIDNKPVQQASVSGVQEEEQTLAQQMANNRQKTIAQNKPATDSKVYNTIATNSPNSPVTENRKDATPVSVIAKAERPLTEITAKTAQVAGRKSEFSQVVSFRSDSLELSLYDNGEIDGDTVSIYLNGEVIMSKQGLKASAIKKTIYITPGNEDFTLVLFAENLGKYAPNTGLLVVRDGEDIYNLRFSSDFQKNAGIVFRRKR